MSEQHEPAVAGIQDKHETATAPEQLRHVVNGEGESTEPSAAQGTGGPGYANGAAGEGKEPATWHAEAGRKGARRIHQLIQEGLRYEEEHGLKRGRQRLRQLIELGKLYEQEHGLRPERRAAGRRLSRMSSEKALLNFFQALLRLSRPSFRSRLVEMIRALETEGR